MHTLIPERMLAVLVKPDGELVVDQIPTPRPGPGQVLIRMAAAPINPSDIGFTKGSYGVLKGSQVIPGFEGSGTVVEAGAGLLPRLLLSRRVTCSTPSGGTWAEYLVVTAQNCFPLNKNLSFEEGSMLIVNPLTALAFFEIAKQGKHTALVNNAAAGALGQMILRLGQSYHVPIIHIVRRQAQVDLLRSLGAQHILNSTDANFIVQLHELSHQLKATLILDPVGGEQTQQLLDAAPSGSTALVYGSLSGIKSNTTSHASNDPTKHIEGFFMPDWLARRNILQVLGYLMKVQRLAKKELCTKIQKQFPLSQVHEALASYQSNPMTGKLLLIADPSRLPKELT
jgi:NADPH:quinone reductase-like Zn-dependent oxidoreductase